MEKDSPMKPKGGDGTYLARNANFKNHMLPLNAQFRLLRREFWNLDESTADTNQYNFTTSRGRGLAINRYINIMAIEETLFPPIPGTKMEKSFYEKLKIPRNRIPMEVIASESETFPLLNGNRCEKDPSTSAIFERTVRILTNMGLSFSGTPVGSVADLSDTGKRQGTDRFLYINGNLIDLENSPLFVASQAPTVAGISDFYVTLYKYKIQIVIMLTKIVENEVEKADQYWPTGNEATLFGDDHAAESSKTGNSLSWGNMTVSVNHDEPYYMDKQLELIYRPLLVQPQDGGAAMPVLHIQYTGWPDLGVPSSEVAFFELLKIMDMYHGTAPVLVHCSAGIGRSGTFIGTYAALQAIRNGRFENKTLYQTVLSMRCARYLMVQRIEQYLFMYMILLRKLGLDMSEFEANLQKNALEYQQEVARAALLRERRR